MVTDPLSPDAEPTAAQPTPVATSFYAPADEISIVLMVIMLVGIVLYPYMVITVPSGHVGVFGSGCAAVRSSIPVS